MSNAYATAPTANLRRTGARERAARPRASRMARTPARRPARPYWGDDLDRDRRVDVGVQVHLHLVRPDAADRLVEPNVLAVDGGAGLRQLRRDVGRGHAAEQPPVLARARRDPQRRRPTSCRRDRLAPRRGPSRPGPGGPSTGVRRAASPPLVADDRHPPRDQEVPRVPVLDLDDVARRAELVDLALQDDLHRVEYGSRAISRAFFTAMATSRWCCTQLPVTRRDRIFPRSETYLRSDAHVLVVDVSRPCPCRTGRSSSSASSARPSRPSPCACAGPSAYAFATPRPGLRRRPGPAAASSRRRPWRLGLGRRPLQAGPDLVGFDLDLAALLAFRRLPRVRPQPADHDHARALRQGLRHVLRELPPRGDVEERRLHVAPLAGLVRAPGG